MHQRCISPLIVCMGLFLLAQSIHSSFISFHSKVITANLNNLSSSPAKATIIRMASSTPEQLKGVRGDSVGGDGIVLMPENEEYTKVIIWNHGLGDTAMGWYTSMPAFKLTGTKFILPTAPTRPITLNMGMPMPGWSDIKGLTKDDEEDEAGFNDSMARIESIVSSEIGKGISPSNIVVGGFSQGGALALYYALQNTHNIAGAVGFSSWLPLQAKFPEALTEAGRSLKILQCHGTADDVVQTRWGLESNEKLKEFGLDAQWETYEGMGHSACEEELEKASEFLKSILE
mmetsp:Transcript_2098/g.2715  ORF Transcript_2098/g.2715 Transcript_2098/m.2715 type:complete len:288 (-) Transcript_2098:348-1211(-)